MMEGIVDNIKMIGVCAAAATSCGTGYVYLGAPVPASKGYVIGQVEQLKSRLIDGQLQTNGLQRDFLRKEKFDRELDISKNPDAGVRSVLQNRLDTINDSLESNVKERSELQREKTTR